MASTDNIVTLETFNSRMDTIEIRLNNIEKHGISIDNTLTLIGYELRLNSRDTEHLQTSIYWGFAVIAIVVALVGFVVALAPMLRDLLHEKRTPSISEDKVQQMIDNSINKAMITLSRNK